MFFPTTVIVGDCNAARLCRLTIRVTSDVKMHVFCFALLWKKLDQLLVNGTLRSSTLVVYEFLEVA